MAKQQREYRILKRFRTVDDGTPDSQVAVWYVVDEAEGVHIGTFMSLEAADRKVRSLLMENA